MYNYSDFDLNICQPFLGDSALHTAVVDELTTPLFSTLVGFGRACAPVRCAHPSF